MQGAVYARHGSADVLEVRDDLPAPARTARHVVVRVGAAGVNPVDFKVRHHEILRLGVPLPKVPGTDLAGEVVHAPPGSPFRVGERVFGMMPLLGSHWGATAEEVPVEARFLAPTPAGLTDAEAASLPLVGLTVLQGVAPAIARLGDPAGRVALVQAGSGGTGSLAVQVLAHVHGMRVIATCSAANADWVRGLGASEVVDYRSARFEDVVQGVDLVFDPLAYMLAERTRQSGVIRPGGHYVQLAGSDWAQGAPAWGVVPEVRPPAVLRGFGAQLWSRLAAPWGLAPHFVHHVFVHPDGAQLRALGAAVGEGLVRPTVERVYPLGEIAQAHRHVEGGHTRGKVVVEVRS